MQKPGSLASKNPPFIFFPTKLGEIALTKTQPPQNSGRRSWPMWRSGFSQRPWVHYCRLLRREGMDLLLGGWGLKLGLVEKKLPPFIEFLGRVKCWEEWKVLVESCRFVIRRGIPLRLICGLLMVDVSLYNHSQHFWFMGPNHWRWGKHRAK